MDSSFLIAAKAVEVLAMETTRFCRVDATERLKPPEATSPQVTTDPSFLIAANALSVLAIETTPLVTEPLLPP